MIEYLILSILAFGCIVISIFAVIRMIAQFHNDRALVESTFVLGGCIFALWSVTLAMLGLWWSVS